MYRLVTAVGEAIELSELTEEVRLQVRALADSIPNTPEPLSDIDPYLRSALLTGVIHALRAAENSDRAELRINVERVRQALRDLLDETPVWRGGSKHAAIWLKDQGLPIPALADLLHTSEASVRRWSNPEDDTEPSGENDARVMVVAKVVNHLRHAMTPRGALNWLQRPHPDLDDRRPADELKDAESYRRLVHLASGARSFIAT